MTEIVNLDDLVPPDIEIHYKGEKYVVDGDTSVDDVFRLFSLYRELAEAQQIGENGEDDTQQAEAVKAAFERVGQHILALLQVRQPDLKVLPFGMKGLMFVIQKVLSQLGLGVIEDEGDGVPPTPPAPKPGASSRASTKTKSPASTRPKTKKAPRNKKS